MSDVHKYQFAHFGTSIQGTYGEVIPSFIKSLVTKVKDDVVKQAKLVPLGQGETFCIGDFGCADGAPSMELVRDLLSSLKQLHGQGTEFQIIYEDLPVNDFNSLFLRLDGIIPDPSSYLPEMNNVFVHACGTSFYEQCVPSEAMHLVISLFAAHWLSKRPTTYKHSIYRFSDSSEEEKTLLHKQAEKDWERFLLLRSRELKSGGRLIVVVPSDSVPDKDGQFRVANGSYFKAASSVWQKFAKIGKITESEFEETNVDICHYNMKQLRGPLENPKSEVYLSGLRLLTFRDLSSPTLDYLAWKHRLEQEGVDDRKQYAKDFVKARRCFTNCVFMSGLSCSRSAAEKAQLVDELFLRVEEVIYGLHPEDLKSDLHAMSIIMYKI